MSGSTLAAAWYGQGLRVIDASNARNLRQVGYFYVTGTDAQTNPSSLSWDTAWRGDLVYLFDMDRGIEILRLKGGPTASARLATVREPRARTDRLAKVPVRGTGLTPGSLVCPLFARRQASAQRRRTRPPRPAAGARSSSVATKPACERSSTRSIAATTSPSNWRPAPRRSSARAASSGSARAVGAVGGHRLVGVGDREDARLERDLLARQARG